MEEARQHSALNEADRTSLEETVPEAVALKSAALLAGLELLARGAAALSKISALVAGFGAILLFGYFIQIRFVPSLGLSELLVFFIASAIIGTLLSFSLAILPWMIGTLWASSFNGKIVAGRSLRDIVGANSQFAFLVFALPVMAFMVIGLFSVEFGWDRWNKYYWLTAAASLSIVPIVLSKRDFGDRLQRTTWCLFVLLVSLFGVSLSVLALSQWISAAEEQITQEDYWRQLLVLVAMGLAIIAVAFFIMESSREGMRSAADRSPVYRRIARLLAGVVGLAVVLTLAGLGNINRSIMRSLGIGGFANTSLVLSDEGRELITSLGYECERSINSSRCVVRGATVHWALGSELLLELPPSTAEIVRGNGSADDTRVEPHLRLLKKHVEIIQR